MENKHTAQLRHRVASTRRISVSVPARQPAREGFRSGVGERGFFNLRVSITLLICTAAACSVVAGALLNFVRPETQTQTSHPTAAGLTFAERVAYQRAIEEVYWRHRIWPKQRPDPKPSLGAVMSQAQLEKKVTDYLRKSEALEARWQRPITAEQLQAEMDRMAKHTKQPEVLHELFAVLGNDPFVIAECLARPVLAERMLRPVALQSGVESLSSRAETRLAKATPAASTGYTLPTISGGAGCVDNWIPIGESLEARDGHTAVWTGTEMIVWGGSRSGEYFNTGGRYNPATDSWTAISTTNAPAARYAHTAVWTGSEMIVWGGYFYDGNHHWLDTGGRYNPGTDTWMPASTINAPSGRYAHTAVWTGSEMIVWGGLVTDFFEANTGGRYNPNTDTWAYTSMINVPTARIGHTAVWTGSEMVIWGGFSATGGNQWFDTGGRYNPNTDSWTATSTTNVPAARYTHTAVWSGTEMIVWGGGGINNVYLNTGGRYNPQTDSWTGTTTTNAPVARESHTALWTGSKMIIWGGVDQSFTFLNTGGTYDPGTDSWLPTSIVNAPVARYGHTGIWTGSEMIVWGGGYEDGNNHFHWFNTGGRYNPNTDSWTPTAADNTPDARYLHTAVWTGSEMIVWGGSDGDSYWNTGGRYNPSTDAWVGITTNGAPAPRESHTAVWTGNEMIVWGGFDGNAYLNTGGRYNPNTDMWTAARMTNAPSAREFHTAVWTGSEMTVWGGYYYDGTDHWLKTGGRYNPTMDTWVATNVSSAPAARQGHVAVWANNEMIIWGGRYGFVEQYLNTGGRYNTSTDSWTVTSTNNSPIARESHQTVWTGTEMIVWGGYNSTNGYLDSGGKYNPAVDSWSATSTTNAPAARVGHSVAWTGSEMIVWGGQFSIYPIIYSNTGGRYDPGTNTWVTTSLINAPTARTLHTAVWSGSEMIVWGGQVSNSAGTSTGARYCAQLASPTPTPRATPTPRFAPTPRARPSPPPRP